MISEAQTAGEIRADLDARLIRLLLIGSTIYALDWFRPNGTNTPKEIADVLAEMFFFGVLPRGKAGRQDARPLLLARRTVGGASTNGAAARARKVSDVTRKLAKSR
jgi:hypothetical protein